MKFDLSEIPNNAIIEKAEIKLTEIPYAESPFWYKDKPVTDYQLDGKLSLYKVIDEWSENSITDFITPFNIVKFDSTVSIASFSYSTGAGEIEFIVTDAIQRILKGNVSNFGFVMDNDYRFTFAKNPGGSVTYWHSGQSEDIAKRPMLKITYTSDGTNNKVDINETFQKDLLCSYKKDGFLALSSLKCENVDIRILNIMGQEIKKTSMLLSVGLSQLSVRDIPSGVIIVQIVGNDYHQLIKLSIP